MAQAAVPPKNEIDAVKFLEQNYKEKFNEEKAKQLFSLYKVDEKDDKLQPPDIRKLLFDLLEARKFPLIVLDESLDEVINELCLDNKEGAISWVEFKSFFLFLEDTPLIKLFQLTTRILDSKSLEYGLWRYITLTPLQEIDEPSFDRQIYKEAILKLLPEATSIFIYFLGGGSLLALVLGTFKNELIQVIKEDDININNIIYGAEIRSFDKLKDIFPPIQRSGGVKSKVARRIADTYVLAKTWDEQNLKIGKKMNELSKKVKESAKEMDDKYKIQEKVNNFSQTVVQSVKEFDEKHQITRRLSAKAKNIDEQYKISQKVHETLDNIKNNENVQSVSTVVSKMVLDSKQAITDISKETTQLVSEKEHDIKSKQEHEHHQINNNNEQNHVNEQNNLENIEGQVAIDDEDENQLLQV